MSLLDTASLIVTPNGYKEGKLYSVIPSDGSGDLSVTRATTATRVNSAGLVELVPYNLLSYSETFASPWGALSGASVSANSATAPNGQNTAATFSVSSTAFSGFIQTLGTNAQCISIYAKKGTLDYLWIVNESISAIGASYNLATGAVTYTASGHTATIESVGDGWYLCTISHPTNGWEYMQFGLSNASNSGSSPSGGNAYIWGAQAVEGSTAKDYQKTETRLNIPRLDYSNGTCPSLLVEPQRTNLFLYSSSFDNAAWNKSSGTITANNTTAPDGTNSADLFTADGTQNNHDFFQGFTGGSSTTSTIYVKKNTAQYAYISLNYQSSGSDWATGIYDLDNLTTATFQSGGVTNQVATISDEGNGWRRITLSVSTANTALFCMYGVADSMSPSLSARGRVENSSSASFYAWGAQLEVGSYATSYIPTTSASVTRNADVISKTGISSLIGQTEGTLFVDFNYDNSTAQPNPLLFTLADTASINEVYAQILSSGGIQVQTYLGGVQQSYLFYGGVTNGHHKIAYTYKQNDFALFVDGVLVATDTSGNVPTTNDFYLGYYNTAFTPSANYKAAALWKTRLTNTQLAALTTI